MDGASIGLWAVLGSAVGAIAITLLYWTTRLLWTVTGDVRALTSSVSKIQIEVEKVTARVDALETRRLRGGDMIE